MRQYQISMFNGLSNFNEKLEIACNCWLTFLRYPICVYILSKKKKNRVTEKRNKLRGKYLIAKKIQPLAGKEQLRCYPIHTFPILEPQNISIDVSKVPDEPFHNFRASRSGDMRILCSSRTSQDGSERWLMKFLNCERVSQEKKGQEKKRGDFLLFIWTLQIESVAQVFKRFFTLKARVRGFKPRQDNTNILLLYLTISYLFWGKKMWKCEPDWT